MKFTSLVLGLATLFSVSLQAGPLARPGFEWRPVELSAIQDRGRIKPFHTFAGESVLFITGKKSWNGMSPTEVVFGWLFAYDKEWQNEPFLRVDYGPLKDQLGLDKSRNYFTPLEIQDNEPFRKVMQEAGKKEERKERLSELEKKAVQLQNQRQLLNSIVGGEAWAMLPSPEGSDKDWYNFAMLGERSGSLPYPPAEITKLADSMKGLIEGFMAPDAKRWNESVYAFSQVLRNDLSKGKYPAASTLTREIHYNELRPFRWAWILYSFAFVVLLVYHVSKKDWAKYAGLAGILAGFGMHIYGFGLRCWISGRPPVTNMYESVIWVTWGCVLFSLVIWAFYKNSVIPTAAAVFAVVGLVLADNIPTVLDPGIHPLEPVLRSNFWLTIHVLTITLSYAAFALSLCLGNVVLGNFIFRPANTSTIQTYSLYMYRAMQIGVVLIAAGTILGGIWADYSWGRFWGWDPKEVWALIALLLYLAVLHGRFSGWLKGFGFVTATVMSFLGVLMAWYGVNFVLGVGLHSYGFGGGGLPAVGAYVAAQLAFIGVAYVRHAKVKLSREVEPSIFPPKNFSAPK